MEVFSSPALSKLVCLIFNLFTNLFNKLVINMKTYIGVTLKASSPQNPTPYPTLNNTHVENFTLGASKKSIVCDMNHALLRTSSPFPFLMLVAFEGGSIFRALLLLLSYPLCLFFDPLKVMVFITFCGMKVEAVEGVARTVLPKFYLEEMNPLVYQMWASADQDSGKAVVTNVLPKVMVDWFGREYLGATHVLAAELHSIKGFFSGFVGRGCKLGLKECFGGTNIIIDVGVGIQSCFLDQVCISDLCKEAYVVSKDTPIPRLPRSKYPKPLIFHDGRLAFLPTPLSTLAMLLYLPLAVPLALLRFLIGILLPYPLATIAGSFSGIRLIFNPAPATNPKQNPNTFNNISPTTKKTHQYQNVAIPHKSHVLYVSNHRTLLDPVFLSVALQKTLTAVTYSLSRLSETLAPIPTIRLTRNRSHDARTMQRLLERGDLFVCPEGTTCREPYLLRFSSLFAELTDEIVPVTVEADVSMFYGTTASGSKWLDPVFFFMNPKPGYSVRVLEKVAREMTCGGGGRSGVEVANLVQREAAEALGFKCTGLTRKDKYKMLVGHDGFVGTATT